MFIVQNRYSIINSGTGEVLCFFDDEKEEALIKTIEDMHASGYYMEKMFVYDVNSEKGPIPALIWAMFK